MKVVIKGGYGLGNFGDDALMYFLVLELSEKFGYNNIIIESFPNSYVKTWFSGCKVSYGGGVYKYDYLLLGGGTLFYSFAKGHSSESVLKKIVRYLKKPVLLFFLIKNRFLNFISHMINYKSKKINLSIGYGPFLVSSHSESVAIRNIKTVDSIIVRDTESYNFASKFRSDIQLSKDICYSNISVKYTDYPNNASSIKKIGIVIRDWKNGTESDDYLSSIVLLNNSLREKGYETEFIIFSNIRDPESTAIMQEYGGFQWDPDNMTISDFILKLKDFDLFITSRFHGAVFSTLLSKPSICVNIEPKLELAYQNAVCEIWNPALDSIDYCCNLVENINLNYKKYISACNTFKAESNDMFMKCFNEVL